MSMKSTVLLIVIAMMILVSVPFAEAEPHHKPGGYIGYLGLDEFWYGLTESERQLILSESAESPVEGEIVSTTYSQVSFLSNYACWAIKEAHWELAEKILSYCEKADGSLVDYHFLYLNVSECYFSQIKKYEPAIDKAIEFCKKDIDLFPQFREPLMIEFDGELPRIPSFQTLAMCYEKQGKYQEAIDVCKLAIAYGITDATKTGFEGRIRRLEKKMRK